MARVAQTGNFMTQIGNRSSDGYLGVIKKRLNLMKQPLSILAIGADNTFESDICTIVIFRTSLNFTGSLAPKTTLSGTKPLNTVRLMRDRWWSNCARFIRKADNTQTRLRPALMVKTDLVDTIGAGHGYQGLVKCF